MIPDAIIETISSTVGNDEIDRYKMILDMLETGEKTSDAIEDALVSCFNDLDKKKVRKYIYALDEMGIARWEMRKNPTPDQPVNKVCYVQLVAFKTVQNIVKSADVEKKNYQVHRFLQEPNDILL